VVLDSEEVASNVEELAADEVVLEAQVVEEVVLEVDLLEAEVEAEVHRFYEVDMALTAIEAIDGATRTRRHAQLPSRSEATGKCLKRLNSQDSASFAWKSTPTSLMRWHSTASSASMTSHMTESRLDNLYPCKSLTESIITLPLLTIQSFKRLVEKQGTLRVP